MRRTTRSQSRQAILSPPPTVPPSHGPILLKNTTTPPTVLFTLPDVFTPKFTGLNRASTSLLNNKRSKLRASITRLRRTFKNTPKATQEQLLRCLDATLVFAQEEDGTAVCISPTGLLLTCAHCVADDSATALNPSAPHWLIFATGTVVRATCVAWDSTRDLALLQITDSEPLPPPTTSHPSSPFPHAPIAPPSPLPLAHPLLCIGHPASEDLEAPSPGRPSGYDVLHISEGAYHGLAAGQDPQDNAEIGALMHDCWTYWGHSGAPLVDAKGAGVVGLHSSWDEETGMRRGVPGVAISSFLEEWTRGGGGV